MASGLTSDLSDVLARKLRKKVADCQVQWRAPSLAALVVRDGAPVHFSGVGAVSVGTDDRSGNSSPSNAPADGASTGNVPTQDTQYRIGSITKTFTATLVMQCRDDGLLSLDDELGKYLPDTKHGGLSIRRMLCHLSGLQREPHGDIWETGVGPDLPTLLSGLEETEAVLPPGRRFHYSNLACSLLGEVVARLRCASWSEALRQRILEPLGLNRTGVEPAPPRAQGYLVDPYADRVHPEPLFPGCAFARRPAAGGARGRTVARPGAGADRRRAGRPDATRRVSCGARQVTSAGGRRSSRTRSLRCCPWTRSTRCATRR